MVGEKTAAVGQLFEMFNRHDVEGIADLVHPDFELHSALAAVEGTPYSGADGLRRYFDDLESVSARSHWKLEAVHDAGDQAVAVYHFTGVAKGSGISGDMRHAQVVTWRDGKIWRLVHFTDPAKALKAVGLSL